MIEQRGTSEPWVKVDRRWWEIHRENDEKRRRIADVAVLLYPWLKQWQRKGVGPDIQTLIEAIEAYQPVKNRKQAE